MNTPEPTTEFALKDQTLSEISASANVAQFVSFGPDLRKRFHLIRGESEGAKPQRAWIEALLDRSSRHSVNVRTFRPRESKTTPFLFGLSTVEDVVSSLSRLADAGFYTIVNETIDMSNGGTGGVMVGNLIEFAPCDTPRAVESPGVTSIARAAGTRMLEIVYQQALPLQFDTALRVEFTIHPTRCGYRNEHTVIWELERVNRSVDALTVSWPNRFSRFIGDKAFGLLVCDALGLRVPKTRVIPRHLPPFEFGESPGTGETWMRTCTTDPLPGKFSTVFGWKDPFAVLASEDPHGELIPSVLAQEGVESRYSGSLVVDSEGAPIIEGVRGTGIAFMLGRSAPERLPDAVETAVRELYSGVRALIGPSSLEWVYDGNYAWIIQVHVGGTSTKGKVIVQGEVMEYRVFDIKNGLEALRNLANSIDSSRTGIIIAGDVGVTSHFGDVLRKAQIVSYIDAK